MTPIEGNKLIAEFIKNSWVEKWNSTEHGNPFPYDKLKYHTSWDWLMPVVEKICNTEMTFKLESVFEWDNKEKYNPKYSMEIRDGGYHLKGSDSSKDLIEVVYQSVIQFITWYNQQNQKQ